MSLSDDDEGLMLWQLKRRKTRKFWIRPSLTELIQHSASLCAKELKAHPAQLKNCYRMSPDNFQTLLNLDASSLNLVVSSLDFFSLNK